jgi:hypothetical protein
MAFLGSQGKETRFADFGRVAGWLDRDSGANDGAGGSLAPPPRTAKTAAAAGN